MASSDFILDAVHSLTKQQSHEYMLVVLQPGTTMFRFYGRARSRTSVEDLEQYCSKAIAELKERTEQ